MRTCPDLFLGVLGQLFPLLFCLKCPWSPLALHIDPRLSFVERTGTPCRAKWGLSRGSGRPQHPISLWNRVKSMGHADLSVMLLFFLFEELATHFAWTFLRACLISCSNLWYSGWSLSRRWVAEWDRIQNFTNKNKTVVSGVRPHSATQVFNWLVFPKILREWFDCWSYCIRDISSWRDSEKDSHFKQHFGPRIDR